MGAVHRETLNQNRGIHEWENISLSETNTIKSLIKNRNEFDNFYNSKIHFTNSIFESNGVPLFKELITTIYLDLERLIATSKLTEFQIHTINLLMKGYTEEEIGKSNRINIQNVYSVLDSACRKIKEKNDYDWNEWLEISGLVKIDADTYYKQCSKCGEWLRADNNNFSPDKTGKYGFRSNCRKCRES